MLFFISQIAEILLAILFNHVGYLYLDGLHHFLILLNYAWKITITHACQIHIHLLSIQQLLHYLVMFALHVHFFVGYVRYPVFREALHKLAEVFFYFFYCHLQRRSNIHNPLLLCQLLCWKLVLEFHKFIKLF